MTYRITCSECCYEDTVEDLEAVFQVEREHQQEERLSHVLEFERVREEID